MLKRPDPKVSIIVCHHTGDLLYGFLASLEAQSFRDFETLVITSDDKLALEGIKGCRVFHSTALPAEKRNIGSRLARGKYLAFFDDDVEIYHDCLYRLVEAIESEPDIGMVYGKLWNMEHRDRFDEAGGYLTMTGFIWSRAGQNDYDRGQWDKREPIFAGKSASCIVKKGAFLSVDGFDEDFGILGEESDLSWRLWLKGYKVIYEPTATGLHAFNSKFKPREKFYTNDRVFLNGPRNYITMLIKNLGTEHLWIIGLHVPIWVGAAVAMCITGKARQGTSILRGIGAVLMNLRGVVRKRKAIQNGRVNGDRDIWDHVFRRPPGGYYRTRILRYITLGLHG